MRPFLVGATTVVALLLCAYLALHWSRGSALPAGTTPTTSADTEPPRLQGPGQRLDSVDVRLLATGRDGEPLEGIHVEWVSKGVAAEGATDELGRIRFRAQPNTWFTVGSDGFVEQRMLVVHDTSELRAVLARGNAVRIRAVGPSGKAPEARTTAMLSPQSQQDLLGASASSYREFWRSASSRQLDDRGFADFVLPAGCGKAHQVRVWTTGGGLWGTTITAPSASVNVVALSPGRNIDVLLVDGEGNPVPDAHVSVHLDDRELLLARSDARGRCQVGVPPDQDSVLLVAQSAKRGVRKIGTAQVPKQQLAVTIHMASRAATRVRVSDASTSGPLPGATVEFYPHALSPHPLSFPSPTNTDGVTSMVLPDLSGGRAALCVTAPGYVGGCALVDPTSDGDVHVALARAASVVLRVMSSSGPVHSARVYVHARKRAEGDPWGVAKRRANGRVTDDNGEVRLDLRPHTEYEAVVAGPSNRDLAETSFTTREPLVLVQLAPALTIQLRITDRARAPVQDVRVVPVPRKSAYGLYSLLQGALQSYTAADGVAEVVQPPHTIAYDLTKPGFIPRRIHVAAITTASHHVFRRYATISGVVESMPEHLRPITTIVASLADGTPLHSLPGERTTAGRSLTGRIEADGRFMVLGALPGEQYNVSVAPGQLSLPEGESARCRAPCDGLVIAGLKGNWSRLDVSIDGDARVLGTPPLLTVRSKHWPVGEDGSESLTQAVMLSPAGKGSILLPQSVSLLEFWAPKYFPIVMRMDLTRETHAVSLPVNQDHIAVVRVTDDEGEPIRGAVVKIVGSETIAYRDVTIRPKQAENTDTLGTVHIGFPSGEWHAYVRLRGKDHRVAEGVGAPKEELVLRVP